MKFNIASESDCRGRMRCRQQIRFDVNFIIMELFTWNRQKRVLLIEKVHEYWMLDFRREFYRACKIRMPKNIHDVIIRKNKIALQALWLAGTYDSFASGKDSKINTSFFSHLTETIFIQVFVAIVKKHTTFRFIPAKMLRSIRAS